MTVRLTPATEGMSERGMQRRVGWRYLTRSAKTCIEGPYTIAVQWEKVAAKLLYHWFNAEDKIISKL